MRRVWAYFDEPSSVLSLVDQLGGTDHVSILVRDPGAQYEVVVMGPITHDMACYPFLDVPHQIRRFGVTRSEADHYVRVLRRGGAVVCLHQCDSGTRRVLDALEAQEISL